MKPATKVYLGDGVYVRLDDETNALILTVEDGVDVQHEIFLDQHVYSNLVRFVEHAMKGGG